MPSIRSYAQMYDLLTNEWGFVQAARVAWEHIDALANSGERNAGTMTQLRDAVAEARELARIRLGNQAIVDRAAEALGITPRKSLRRRGAT